MDIAIGRYQDPVVTMIARYDQALDWCREQALPWQTPSSSSVYINPEMVDIDMGMWGRRI